MSKKTSELNNNQVSYINGCSILQRAVWRFTHKDPLNAMVNKVSSYILRDATLLMINIRERLQKLKMRMILHKWLQNCMKMNEISAKKKVLLKLIILAKDAKYKALLAKYFQKWKSVLNVSEKEILDKYGVLFKLLDNLKDASLKPIKKDFFKKLRAIRNPTLLKKPAKKLFKLYDKNLKDLLKKNLFNWRINAKNLAMKELKKRLLRNAIVLLINRGKQKSLLRALKNWHNNVLLEKIGDNKINNLFLIYAKWKKFSAGNKLQSALLKWRNNIINKNDLKPQQLLNAKKHMLKHNINKNAEDLLNAMRFIQSYKKRSPLLRKLLNKKQNLSNEILRNYLKKWYNNAKNIANRDLLKKNKLKHVIDLNELNNRNLINNILRKALNTWRRNCIALKKILSDTEKGSKLLRKAAISPFFNKIKQKILKDQNKKKFNEIIKKFMKNGDKDLLHWWFGEWRKKTRKLREYNIRTIFINYSLKCDEEKDKLRALKNIQNRAIVNNNKQKILKILLNKFEDLGNKKYKEKIATAFYRWKANAGNFKTPYEIIQPYKDGTEILQRFVWRTTHPDILNSFNKQLTEKAKKKLLTKLLLYLNKNYVKDLLRKYFYKWKFNCRKNNGDDKLRTMFEKYLLTEPIRSKLMSPYKDIVDVMLDFYNEKQKAAKDIEELLRGIEDIPSQIKRMKIMILFTKLLKRFNIIPKYKLKSALKEWTRKARALKAESDAKIIQKFIREKLRKRLLLKECLEEAIELTTRNILRKALKKILDRANKNKIPDILIKYFLRKDADNMKNLKDKFDYWKNLLPYLRRDDAAAYIQACFRGKKFRDDFDNAKKIIYLLRNIVERYALRSEIEPAWQKWKKNDRLEKCDEDSKIIQHFLRKKLQNKLKNEAKNGLKNLFKNLFFKKLAEILKKCGRINPEAAENLYHVLMSIACKEPFNKLKNAAKWKKIMNKLKNLPDILDRLRKNNLKKYLDRWYENGFLLPNQAAEEIQAVYRGYLARKAGNKNRLKNEILIKLIGKYVISDDVKLLSALMKWNKNARLDKCGEDSTTIQRFCQKLRNRMKKNLKEKWANLAKKLLIKRINNLAKFKKLNDLLNKLLKKKYLKKLLDNALKERLKDLLKYLLTKYNDKAEKELLRQKLHRWRDIVKILNDLDYDAAAYIQSIWRGYKERKKLGDKYKLKAILMRLLQKNSLNSRNGLLAALQKWAKNARLGKCEENSTIIQNFSKKFINLLRRLKYHNYLKRIGEGLNKLANLRPNLKWAFDKIRNAPKEDAFHNLMDTLKNIFNKRKKDTLDDIKKYIINLILSKLCPFRKNWIDNILRKKLKQWNNIAQKLKKLDNRLKELLLKLLAKYGKNREDLLRYYLNKWKNNAFDISKDIASNKIAKYLNDRFKIAGARKNWKNLADKLRNNVYGKETKDLINGISKYMALSNLLNNLDDKIEKDGCEQLKSGNYWLKILSVLRKLLDDQNERNNNKILKKYLNKWKDITDKLNDRENKLNDALNKIDQKQLINDINTIGDASSTLQIIRAVPIARISDFLNKFKKKYEDEVNLRLGKNEYSTKLLVKILKKLLKNQIDYLKRKLRQWRDNAKKITEEAAKKRITDYIVNKYLTSNARKNWKKLCDDLNSYNRNKDLHSLIKKLKKIMALKNLSNMVDTAFKKPLISQFRDGANWVSLLRFLKNLFDDLDDKNNLLKLKHYLNKWNNKAKKLKKRDDALDEALNNIEKRILINNINTVNDSSVSQQIIRAVPLGRTFDFLNKIKKNYELWNKLYDKFLKFLEKYINSTDDNVKNILRKKLRQWKNNAHKITEEIAKNRIAKWIEEKYKFINARKNWKDLSDKYELFKNKNLLNEIRKKLRNYAFIKDLTSKLRNKFEKTGNDQFKKGVKYLSLLQLLKNLFNNLENRNNSLKLKHYLNKWNNKAKKLKKRDDALDEALNNIEKRILINGINTVNDSSVSQQIIRAVPLGRTFDFLNKIKKKYDLWNKLKAKFLKFLDKYIKSSDENIKNILRKKLRQWKNNAHKITEEIAKNRIAKWLEEKYKLTNARKNWKNLSDKYELFKNKNLLNEIRKKLRNYALIKDLTSKLRNKFEKTGNDQFKKGAKYLSLLQLLKNLFNNWENRNNLLKLKHYLNKWNNKAKKLKEREEAIKESFDILNVKNLTNSANTVKNSCIVKGINAAVPVARIYDFLNRLKEIANKKLIYSKLANDLVEVKKETDDQSKDLLLRKLYKIYYYKIIDNFFNKLKKLQNKYKKRHIAYFLNLLHYLSKINKSENIKKTISKESTPKSKQLIFKSQKTKTKHTPTDKSVIKLLLPSFIKFLNDKFLQRKNWALEKLKQLYKAKKFAELYKIFSNKTILNPKRDLIDLMKANHLYMNGLGASYCDLYKLLRRYWVRRVSDSLRNPSRVYKILYLVKMVMMHKAISYQRFIREMIRKWRFSTFIYCLTQRKLQILYKIMHVLFLEMTNEVFGDKGCKNASVIKEFERFSSKIGAFTNENYNYPNEENYCEKIMKKYIFYPMQILIEKEGPSNFFCSGIEVEDSGENNEDYYVDQDIVGETTGKYKQDTSKSVSRILDNKY